MVNAVPPRRYGIFLNKIQMMVISTLTMMYDVRNPDYREEADDGIDGEVSDYGDDENPPIQQLENELEMEELDVDAIENDVAEENESFHLDQQHQTNLVSFAENEIEKVVDGVHYYRSKNKNHERQWTSQPPTLRKLLQFQVLTERQGLNPAHAQVLETPVMCFKNYLSNELVKMVVKYTNQKATDFYNIPALDGEPAPKNTSSLVRHR